MKEKNIYPCGKNKVHKIIRLLFELKFVNRRKQSAFILIYTTKQSEFVFSIFQNEGVLFLSFSQLYLSSTIHNK